MKADVFRQIADGTAKMCNCAECGKELLSLCYAAQVAIARQAYGVNVPYDIVAGRIKGRPYCAVCIGLAASLAR